LKKRFKRRKINLFTIGARQEFVLKKQDGVGTKSFEENKKKVEIGKEIDATKISLADAENYLGASKKGESKK
jgi:hypothetical protein